MKYQRGQAIVIVALMMVVLLGFVALAIDSARAYNGRRTLQDAVDAAALYAADSYKAGSSWSVSQTAGATLLATDLRIYTAPSCGAFLTPTAGGAPISTTCTIGAVTVQVTASDKGPGGQAFTYSATQHLAAALIQVVGQNPDITLTALASATALDQGQQPAVVSLSTAGCYGVSGTSLAITGSAPVSVYGDMVSNGKLSVDGSSTLVAAGDILSRCATGAPTAPTTGCWRSPAAGTFPPSPYAAVLTAGSCTAPAVLGRQRIAFRRADPGYSAPSVAGLSNRGTPQFTVSLSPGIYNSDPNFGDAGFFNNTCYFLAPGIYDFPVGASFNSGMTSNELRPPESTDPFWTGGGAGCQGGFAINASATGPALTNGTWAIWLTSTRSDVIGGVTYARESAPSLCQAINLTNQSIHIIVSNVPGAQGYKVYGRKSNCAQATTTYGYLGRLTNGVNESNLFAYACPDTAASPGGGCGLGQATGDLLATGISNSGCIPVTPGPAISLDSCGQLLPDQLGAAYRSAPAQPLQNPGRATVARPVTSVGGDLANYNLCTTGGVRATCPGTLTPGAVTFYLPNTACFSLNSGADAVLFSGAQYNWIVVNEPLTNTCTGNSLTATYDSALVGAIYAPGATVAISGLFAFESADFGGLTANQVTIDSAGGLALGLNPNVAPAKPAVRLSG